MQRPVMDPMVMLENDPEGSEPVRWTARLRAWLARCKVAALWIGKVLCTHPFRARRRTPEDEQPTLARLLRGLGYRLLFVPIFLAIASAVLVYRGTHPVRLASDRLPEVPGMFYETLEFAGPHGQPLMAWFVPVVDAKRVLELKNKVLKGKQPAVVLVHDFNASPSQMVPLVAPLHDSGYVVMVVGLRGAGRGRVAAQTFGLNEAGDVSAALAELRKRPTVDTDRIVLAGIGSGANAAVIAAAREPSVRALVLVDAFENPDEAIAQRIGPDRAGLRWMQPAVKWAFEVAYHVDADDLSLSRFREVLVSRPTLTLELGEGRELSRDMLESIRSFCQEHIPVPDIGQSMASGL